MMDTAAWELQTFELTGVKAEQLTDDVAVIAYIVREDLTVDGKNLTLEAADASTWMRDGSDWTCSLHTESVLGGYLRERPQAACKETVPSGPSPFGTPTDPQTLRFFT